MLPNRHSISTLQNYEEFEYLQKKMHKKTLCANKNTAKWGWNLFPIPKFVKFA